MTALQPSQQAGSHVVVEMAEATAYPLFQSSRISAGLQHPDIMIAFEHQRGAATKHFHDMGGDMAGIGEYTQPMLAIGENKLHWLARIVRHRKRLD